MAIGLPHTTGFPSGGQPQFQPFRVYFFSCFRGYDLLSLAAFAKGINQADRRPEIRLPLQLDVGIVKGSAQIVRTHSHGKGPRQAILKSSTAGPRKSVRVSEHDLAVAFEIYAS